MQYFGVMHAKLWVIMLRNCVTARSTDTTARFYSVHMTLHFFASGLRSRTWILLQTQQPPRFHSIKCDQAKAKVTTAYLVNNIYVYSQPAFRCPSLGAAFPTKHSQLNLGLSMICRKRIGGRR